MRDDLIDDYHNRKVVLHVGHGGASVPEALFPPSDWQETTLDISPFTKPDICCNMTRIPVPDNSYEAIYSSHNLEHLLHYEVLWALAEFYRVLKPNGVVYIMVPDMVDICKAVIERGLFIEAYKTPDGLSITPVDMLYGYRPGITPGHDAMCHRTGFTKESLEWAMSDVGFDVTIVPSQPFEIFAIGIKP